MTAWSTGRRGRRWIRQWTSELTVAVKVFQKALGAPATGAVDAATLAALDGLLGATPARTTGPTSGPSES